MKAFLQLPLFVLLFITIETRAQEPTLRDLKARCKAGSIAGSKAEKKKETFKTLSIADSIHVKHYQIQDRKSVV